jgi:hypothetical protein
MAPSNSDNGESAEKPAEPLRTGIVDSFLPYAPKIIEEPAPSPPKLVEEPPPPPPRLVEEQSVPPARPIEEPDSPEPEPVKFFETETRARSVGYVVDCSSSMSGEKFQAVCLKLAESILELKRNQKFFIVFFNDSFFCMTGNAMPKLVPADAAHKRDVLRFLANAQASGGTNPEPALQCMTRIDPDVVYLLTDGEFSPLGEATYRGLDDAGIVVHTLGFETAGTVSTLEEIARRTGGSYQPAARGSSNVGLLFAADQVVRRGLASPDPVVRRQAARAAVLRGLPFEVQLIDMLREPDDDLREMIHEELKAAADGSDFGPMSAADVDDAIRRWKLWRSLRKAGRSRLITFMGGDDLEGLWVAAGVARAMRIEAPDEFIAALRRAPPAARSELRAALVQCAAGEDFGPAADAPPEEVQAAANRWQDWRNRTLAAERAANFERRVKRAADLLNQAKNLIGINNSAVKRRLEELVSDYADTPAGIEARRLLAGRSSSEPGSREP